MKNIVKICITLMMILVMAVPTFAADFVPSISEKPGLDLEIMGEDENGPWYGEIIDKDGNVVMKLYEGDIIVTPIANIDEADIPQEAKDLLKKVYQDLLDGNASLADVEGLLEELQKALGDEAGIDDIVIKDLFDVTVINPEALELLADGYKLRLTFDLGLSMGEFLAVMDYAQKWNLVYDYVVNEDGTVTVILNQTGPVGFLTAAINQYVDGENIPETGDTTNVALWAGVGVLAAGLFALAMRRRTN